MGSRSLVRIWIWLQTILGIRIQIRLLPSILIRIPWSLWWIPWILLRIIELSAEKKFKIRNTTNLGRRTSIECPNIKMYTYLGLCVKYNYIYCRIQQGLKYSSKLKIKYSSDYNQK